MIINWRLYCLRMAKRYRTGRSRARWWLWLHKCHLRLRSRTYSKAGQPKKDECCSKKSKKLNSKRSTSSTCSSSRRTEQMRCGQLGTLRRGKPSKRCLIVVTRLIWTNLPRNQCSWQDSQWVWSLPSTILVACHMRTNQPRRPYCKRVSHWNWRPLGTI